MWCQAHARSTCSPNAIKFTPEGGCVEVGAVPRYPRAVAPEDQEAVWQRAEALVPVATTCTEASSVRTRRPARGGREVSEHAVALPSFRPAGPGRLPEPLFVHRRHPLVEAAGGESRRVVRCSGIGPGSGW